MRKLLKIFFLLSALFLIFCFCGFAVQMANAEICYEGEFSPDEFLKWERVSVIPCPSGGADVHMVIKSPDGLIVELIIDVVTRLLVEYSYTKDGVDYEFKADFNTYCYKQVKSQPKAEWPNPVDEYSSFTKPI